MDDLLPLYVHVYSSFVCWPSSHPGCYDPPPDAIFLYILIALTTRAKSLGRPFAWAEPIVELPWFGQWPGYPEGQYPQNGMYQMPYAYPAGQPMSMGSMGSMGYPAGGQVAPGYVIQQNPGHSVVIQPGVNGQPPTITQVPGSVSSV